MPCSVLLLWSGLPTGQVRGCLSDSEVWMPVPKLLGEKEGKPPGCNFFLLTVLQLDEKISDVQFSLTPLALCKDIHSLCRGKKKNFFLLKCKYAEEVKKKKTKTKKPFTALHTPPSPIVPWD